MADLHPGDGGLAGQRLEHYWKHGAGASKWIGTATPWTNLYHDLARHMPPEMAKRVASQWFHDVFGFWPGSDLNRVTHGHAPRGHRVGPG